MSRRTRASSSRAAGQQVADGPGIVDHGRQGNAGTNEADEWP
jgi:hypothetical protein